MIDRYTRVDDDAALRLDLGEILFSYSWETLQHAVAAASGPVIPEAVNAWSLIGNDLILELDQRSAAVLGWPVIHALRLDLPPDDLVAVRDTLIEILEQDTCFLVDCAGRYLRV